MPRRKHADQLDIEFGHYIRQLRRVNSQGASLFEFIELTNEKVDSKCWISIDHWRDIESGKSRMPLSMLLKVSFALEIEPETLLHKYVRLSMEYPVLS